MTRLTRPPSELRKPVVPGDSLMTERMRAHAENINAINKDLTNRAPLDSGGDLDAGGGYRQQITGLGRSGISAASTTYDLYWGDNNAIPEFWGPAERKGSIYSLGVYSDTDIVASEELTIEIIVYKGTAGTHYETYAEKMVGGDQQLYKTYTKNKLVFNTDDRIAMRAITGGTWTTTIAIVAKLGVIL